MPFFNQPFAQSFPGRPGNVDPNSSPSGMEAWQRNVETALAEIQARFSGCVQVKAQPNLQFNDGPIAGAVAFAALPRC